MAIFSLHHSFIGRSTHPAGAASAYGRYITRNEACTVILGERMPLDRSVYAWLDKQEPEDRKNARVVDRVTVALPSDARLGWPRSMTGRATPIIRMRISYSGTATSRPAVAA